MVDKSHCMLNMPVLMRLKLKCSILLLDILVRKKYNIEVHIIMEFHSISIQHFTACSSEICILNSNFINAEE
jgi:hypothetical protein